VQTTGQRKKRLKKVSNSVKKVPGKTGGKRLSRPPQASPFNGFHRPWNRPLRALLQGALRCRASHYLMNGRTIQTTNLKDIVPKNGKKMKRLKRNV